jgi:hypothetical protein
MLRLLPLLLLAARAQPEDDSKAVIDRAIKAHGGESLLAKKAYKAKLKTVWFGGEQPEVGTGSTTAQGKTQARIEIDDFKAISVVNGDKGWNRSDGTTSTMDKAELDEALEGMYLDWVCTLAPLQGKGFTLKRLTDDKVLDKPALGVRVTHAGHPDIDLYFDKATSLLVKKSFQLKSPDGTAKTFSTVLSDFRAFGKIQWWTKAVTQRDGKKRSELEIIDLQFFDRLDDMVFAKP